MTISTKDVEVLAQLAALSFDEAEISQLSDKLNHVFALIEKMSEVNTDAVLPMAHPADMVLRLREDIATAPNQRDAFLAPAPKTADGLFLVPRVIE